MYVFCFGGGEMGMVSGHQSFDICLATKQVTVFLCTVVICKLDSEGQIPMRRLGMSWLYLFSADDILCCMRNSQAPLKLPLLTCVSIRKGKQF